MGTAVSVDGNGQESSVDGLQTAQIYSKETSKGCDKLKNDKWKKHADTTDHKKSLSVQWKQL